MFRIKEIRLIIIPSFIKEKLKKFKKANIRAKRRDAENPYKLNTVRRSCLFVESISIHK